MISDLEIGESKVVKKALGILGKELTIEEYAKFLAVITLKIGNSVKELREFRDAETEEEFLTRMKRRGADVVP
ncbi:MAG: hypothetical protein ISS94_05675 [Candidatus Syntrophoarchaeum sp.]|nr:hypothetical protein [Candidatus Syntrophoarchaeum sp.]